MGCDVRDITRNRIIPKFQSTHPRGVRRHPSSQGRRGLGRFNPRTRVGCDVHHDVAFWRGVEVSIHAPAWGATRYRASPGPAEKRFNPRTRVGCDTGWRPTPPLNKPFQSTHPRGVRHGSNLHSGLWCEFQSTHPRGVRPDWRKCTCCESSLFQSTHPRGVRRRRRWCPRTSGGFVSIHAPAWGATWQLCWPCAGEWGFNPRTRVGCDRHAPVI